MGSGRPLGLSRSPPSCLNRPAQRTDFVHGLTGVEDRPVHGGVEAAQGDDVGRVLVPIVEAVVRLRQTFATQHHERGAELVIAAACILQAAMRLPAVVEGEGLEAVGTACSGAGLPERMRRSAPRSRADGIAERRRRRGRRTGRRRSFRRTPCPRAGTRRPPVGRLGRSPARAPGRRWRDTTLVVGHRTATNSLAVPSDSPSSVQALPSPRLSPAAPASLPPPGRDSPAARRPDAATRGAGRRPAQVAHGSSRSSRRNGQSSKLVTYRWCACVGLVFTSSPPM